jgi:outer membrane receptor protein involved in Fe transport
MTSDRFARALLLSTALSAFGLVSTAWAQTPPPAEPAPPAEQPAEEAPVDISGPGADAGLGEIVVIGRNIPNVVRTTPEVISVLTAEDIARTGDGDVAGALLRVTGLSVVRGGFVYVRGLGERYSLALLNGSPIPSPEPLRRSVPLDIFPTSLLASSVVQKSYSVNFPGEFGGGAINLTTKAVPDEPFFKVGVGTGGDTETTFQLGYTYYGSPTDFLGFDNGRRSLPAVFRSALNSGNLITEGGNFTRAQIKEITISLNNASTSLIQRNNNIPANFSADFEGGTAFDVGDGRMGVIVSGGFSNSWRTRGGIKQVSNSTGGNLDISRNFRFLDTQNQVVVNGLLGIGYEFADNKIRWTNLIIRDTVKDAEINRGIDFGNANPEAELIEFGTSWFERQLISTQLVGEFRLTDDLRVDARANYAQSTRDAPYERSSSYQFNTRANDFVNDLRTNGQDSRVAFSDLTDEVIGASLDVSYKLQTEIPLAFSAGYTFFDNTRESVRRDFQYRPDQALRSEIAQQRIDFLLSDFNVQNFDILLVDATGSDGAAAFDAGLRVHAGYLQAEIEPMDGLRATVGVRYESGNQFVTPRAIGGAGSAFLTPTRIKNDYWLPAATITWNFAEDMQLRLSGSQTVARPQFRELARQPYSDLETGRLFSGNPFLQDSKLTNADLRYEWYPSRNDRLSVAGFFKKIDRPIESIASIGSDRLTQTFANAPSADLYGFEIEAQKFLPLADFGMTGFWELRRAVLIANYTFTKSSISVGAGDVTFPVGANGAAVPASQLFGDGDKLTGQSDHLLNLQIGLEHEERLSQQTLLINFASDRVSSRGPNQQPDLIEKPGVRIDFVAREGFSLWGREYEVKFEARNLLGTDFEESQRRGDQVIFNNAYDLGQAFSFSISIAL